MNIIFKNRQSKIFSEMSQRKIDALLVSDPLSIFYFTGIHVNPMERLFALYFEKGETVLFANTLFCIKNADCKVVLYSDGINTEDFLSAHILKQGTLGIDGMWPARFLIPLMKKIPDVNFVCGSECVDSLRGCKDAQEISLMKTAAAIADDCLQKAFSFIHDGVTEKEVASYIDSLFAKAGAEPSFETIVSFGKNAADPHHVPDGTKPSRGDVVLIDLGCKKNGYCSDMTRTSFFLTAPKEVAQIHDIVRRANEYAKSIIKPGVALKDIDSAARNLIEEAGYGKNFTHRLGHFCGMTDHEAGDVSQGSTLTAREGMIFSIEPGIYIEGKTGIRIEDLVLVTKDGCESLNKLDSHWHILG